MVRSAPGEVERLRSEVETALREQLDAEDVLPLLARLARAADPESDAWLYAHRHLAEIGVEHDPWRAALFARRVITCRPDDDGAWAVLGLSQSLLGNFRFAAHAYERALTLAPDNPWYAHNLGHLYDVALGRPADALPLLSRATAAQPGEADIAASYAHALARCGNVAAAKRVLRRATRRGATADQAALSRWLDAGAPAHWTGRDDPSGPAVAPPPTHPDPSSPPVARGAGDAPTVGEAAAVGTDDDKPAGPPGPSIHDGGRPPMPPGPAGPADGGSKKPRRRRSRERRTAGD